MMESTARSVFNSDRRTKMNNTTNSFHQYNQAFDSLISDGKPLNYMRKTLPGTAGQIDENSKYV
jgi:hypothetical protein